VANLIFLDFTDGKKVMLDMGCGTGGSTYFLAANQELELIVGVDVVKSMIEVAKGKSLGSGLKNRMEFIVSDARQLPFRASVFEALISRGDVFPWLIPQDEALVEFCRVMKAGAVMAMEMDNGALLEPGTAKHYFEKGRHGEVIYVESRIDADRNSSNTYYVLEEQSSIASKVSDNKEFEGAGWFSGDNYPLREIEGESREVREGLATHWYTANELREVLEAYGFKDVEIRGDGLLMKMLLEGDEELVGFMKKHSTFFLEIERKLTLLVNPEKAPTLICKAIKQ